MGAELVWPAPDTLLIDLISEVVITHRAQRPPRLGWRRLELRLLNFFRAFHLHRREMLGTTTNGSRSPYWLDLPSCNE